MNHEIIIGERYGHKSLPIAMILLDAETKGGEIFVGLFEHPKGLEGFAWFGKSDALWRDWEKIQ